MSYLTLLNQIACVTAEIADNGFGPTPPPAPTNLEAFGNYDSVSLTWDDSGADSYNVYRGTVDGGPYTLIGNTGINDPEYEDDTSVNWTTYYYVVTGVVGALESANSSQVSAMSEQQPEAWYDGNSTGSVPGAITSWVENNGQSGRDLAGTATVLAANQNGLNTVSFNGTTDHMDTAALGTPTARTVIAVVKSSNTTAAPAAVNFGGGAGTNRSGLARQASGGVNWNFATNSATSNVPFVSGAVDIPGVLAWTYDSPGNAVRLFRNGAFVTATDHNATDGGVSAALHVGSSTGAAGFKASTWMELLIYDSIIPDAAITFKSAQLTAKWAV